MISNILLFFLVMTCHGVLKAGGLLHSRRHTPPPIDSSCTRELVQSLSCQFEDAMCGYTNIPLGSEAIRWHNTGPITYKLQGRKYLTVSEFGHKALRGAHGVLKSVKIDPDVEAVCIEFLYRTVGYPTVGAYNELPNGQRRRIGSVTDSVYPEWRYARFHSCVAENSYITFTYLKRAADYSSFDMDSLRVTKSSMNCSSYRNETRQISNTTTKITQAPKTTDVFNVTANSISSIKSNTISTTTAAKQSCTAAKIGQLSCDFQKDLCGYSSSSRANSSLVWRRNWFLQSEGISVGLSDPYLNARVGADARLKGAIIDPNVKAVCIEFAYWGEHNSTLSVYNEQADGSDLLIGQMVTDNPNQRKLAQFRSCVSKNSFISLEASKVSKNSLHVWVDDLKVTESTMDCPGSPSTPLAKHASST